MIHCQSYTLSLDCSAFESINTIGTIFQVSHTKIHFPIRKSPNTMALLDCFMSESHVHPKRKKNSVQKTCQHFFSGKKRIKSTKTSILTIGQRVLANIFLHILEWSCSIYVLLIYCVVRLPLAAKRTASACIALERVQHTMLRLERKSCVLHSL